MQAGEGDTGDQAELMLFRPVRVPALVIGVSKVPYGTLSTGEG